MKVGMLILVPTMFLTTNLFFLQIPGENGMVPVTPTAWAAEPLDSQAAAATPSAGGADTPYSYVGTNKCKRCHLAEHRSWKKTKMAQTLETLKPGNAVEVKKKYGLDPAKDYSTDQGCLNCHTTGYDHQGGYAIPDPEDKKAVRRAKKLAGVGCESCHGPGSAYIDVFMDIFKSKRQYKVEELYAAPCSCLVRTNLIEESSRASMTWAFSSPGTPKMWVTPSFSRHLANSSAAFIHDSKLFDINLGPDLFSSSQTATAASRQTCPYRAYPMGVLSSTRF